MLKRPVSGRSVETSSEMIKWWSPWNFIYKSSLERTILDQLWNSNHLTWFWYSYNVNRLQCVNFSQILSVKTTMSFTTKLLKIHIYLIWRIKNAILIWFHSRVRALMAARPNAIQRHSLYRRRLERHLNLYIHRILTYSSIFHVHTSFACLTYDTTASQPRHGITCGLLLAGRRPHGLQPIGGQQPYILIQQFLYPGPWFVFTSILTSFIVTSAETNVW